MDFAPNLIDTAPIKPHMASMGLIKALSQRMMFLVMNNLVRRHPQQLSSVRRHRAATGRMRWRRREANRLCNGQLKYWEDCVADCAIIVRGQCKRPIHRSKSSNIQRRDRHLKNRYLKTFAAQIIHTGDI